MDVAGRTEPRKGGVQKWASPDAWQKSKESSGIFQCGGMEEIFKNGQGRALKTDLSRHYQLLAASRSWSHCTKEIVKNSQLPWLSTSLQPFLLATRCQECTNPAHFLAPWVWKSAEWKWVGEISKKGISRSFRATANKQKKKKIKKNWVECRQAVFSPRPTKKNCLHFFIHLFFWNLGRFSG